MLLENCVLDTQLIFTEVLKLGEIKVKVVLEVKYLVVCLTFITNVINSLM